MSAIDSNFGFDAVFRQTAADLKLRLARDAGLANKPLTSRQRGGIAAFAVFAGLGMLSVLIFVIGYSATLSDEPMIWIHRLMALAVMQSIFIAAVTMRLIPVIERRRSLIRIGPSLGFRQTPDQDVSTRSAVPMPPPLPEPRKPVVGGKLAGREFLEYEDGSIEIDTLIGRRRFASLAAAREFVGS
ncbi:hypothetical protein [Hyphomicrobium sp.]|uniref:hypothetical protein n=1 Tax=Hyphomicrobium sp. TaxID=82 RepID=UPI000F941389|nr:hypothetical protein [Hyphomicrobium sp.]MBN9247377.1 hypothetical protein [Hyphomicrobium sp.]RUP07500.1 MAG: hypothetical protein EKK38_18125 [Hyphomicrobium sp.]